MSGAPRKPKGRWTNGTVARAYDDGEPVNNPGVGPEALILITANSLRDGAGTFPFSGSSYRYSGYCIIIIPSR